MMLSDNQPLTHKQDYGKVAVLLGGRSAEREISLKSGEAVYNSLIKQGINSIKIDPAENLAAAISQHQPDRVFIALHGREGEDGVIQGYLKTLGIPFTGSDVESSALAMNKLQSKRIWQHMGLVTADFVVAYVHSPINQQQATDYFNQLGSPLFVKPIREGSSMGISRADSASELIDAVKNAQVYDDLVLIEKFIDGHEYSVSILDNKTLPSIKIAPTRNFYDYQAKYQAAGTEYFCPSGLNDAEEQQLQQDALEAFNTLGCSAWGRVDFIRDKTSNQFLILEVNTVPGMTESSLVPKAAKADGIDFDRLVIKILHSSFNCQTVNTGCRHD